MSTFFKLWLGLVIGAVLVVATIRMVKGAANEAHRLVHRGDDSSL